MFGDYVWGKNVLHWQPKDVSSQSVSGKAALEIIIILLRNIQTLVWSVHCLYLSSYDYILLRACTAHFLPVMMDGVMSSSARPGHLFQLEWLWSCWEAVWLVGSSELSTGKASCQMPVYVVAPQARALTYVFHQTGCTQPKAALSWRHLS